MALVDTTDVENRLGRDLTDEETARLPFIIDDVSAAVIGYTGQSFELDTTTIRLKVKYGVVRLPQRPVVSVDSVETVAGADVSYTWDTRDRLDIPGCGTPINAFEVEPFRHPLNYVNVTYEHGYTETPPDVVGVVCSIILRTLGQAPTDGAVISESIDDYTYRLGSTGAAGAFGLLADERATLDRYKRAGGSMVLAR